MSKNYNFWDKVFDNLDEKLVNETAEEIFKRQSVDINFSEIVVERSEPKKFNFGAIIGIAAAAVLLVGTVSFIGFLKSGGFSIAESKPYVNTTEYESVRIYRGNNYYTDIDLSIADDYSRTAVELIERLNKTELKAAEYSALTANDNDFYVLELYRENGENDSYKLCECFDGDITPFYYVGKNGEDYEIGERDYFALIELIERFTDTLITDVTDGTYYPLADSGYSNEDVYITVDSGKIWLGGRNSFDFIYESLKKANPEEKTEELTRMTNEDYEKLGIKSYKVSDFGGINDYIKVGNYPYPYSIVTDYSGEKINGNGYGRGIYLFDGMNSITLYETEFKLGGTESVVYEADFSRGHISFSEIGLTDVISINDVCAKFESRTDAKEYLVGLTIGKSAKGMAGVYRLGETTLKGYKLNLNKSYYRHGYPVATLYYDGGEGTYFKINTSDKWGTGKERAAFPNGLSINLDDDEFFDYKPTYSEFRLEDGTTLNLRMGGAYYGYAPYYQAEWTDPSSELSICISSRNLSIDEFINVVVTLVYDVDGLNNISADDYNLPTDFDSYTMDFSVFYNYFRGEWLSDDGEKLDIGWNDNVFTYAKTCAGFLTNGVGACMLQENNPDENTYTLWYIPNYDKTALFKHSYILDGETRSWKAYDKAYRKTDSGDFSGLEGIYGNLGLQELCTYEEIDYNSLFNVEFTDESGNRWVRTNDTSIDWGVTGVSERSFGTVILHLKMLNPETNEMKYFSFTYVEDENGNKVLKDEHYAYDISILDYENYPSKIVEEIKESVSIKEYDDRLMVESDFINMNNGSYYVIRLLGTAQAQWLGDIEVYYNDGNGYKLISDEYTAIMGMVYTQNDSNRLYVLWCNLGEFYYSENTFNVDCIEKGEIVSSITLTDLTLLNGFQLIHEFNLNNNIIEVIASNGYDNERAVVTVDYSDPRNPTSETRREVVGEEIPQNPAENYRYLIEIGEQLETWHYFSPEDDTVLAAKCMVAVKNDKAKKLYYDNGECLVIVDKNGEDFYMAKGDTAEIYIKATYVSDYSSVDGELTSIGYLKNYEAYEFYSGKIGYDGEKITFTAPEDGYYKFYFINACEGFQNYELVHVMYNKQALIEGYEEKVDEIISQYQHEYVIIKEYEEVINEFKAEIEVKEKLISEYEQKLPDLKLEEEQNIELISWYEGEIAAYKDEIVGIKEEIEIYHAQIDALLSDIQQENGE